MPQHVENTAHRTGIELKQLSAGYRQHAIVHDVCLTIPQGKMSAGRGERLRQIHLIKYDCPNAEAVGRQRAA